MSKLYVEELAIAGAAARGEWDGEEGDGDHVGKVPVEAEAVLA